MGVEAAKVFLEFRLLQQACFPELEQSVRVTRQHQQWDRWQQQSAAWAVPAQHWRAAKPSGQGPSGARPVDTVHRCLSTASVSCYAGLWLVASWAARAKGAGVQEAAKNVLTAFINKYTEGLSMEIALDRHAKASSSESVL
eukprot:611471-Lingulodinium_polyedra.AAC.1